jgi:hypothetical protein
MRVMGAFASMESVAQATFVVRVNDWLYYDLYNFLLERKRWTH